VGLVTEALGILHFGGTCDRSTWNTALWWDL
jgi:hypothetical protein